MTDMRNIQLHEGERLDSDSDSDSDRPPTYSEASGTEQKKGFDKKYVFSVPGALKIIAVVLDLIGFIAALADFTWTAYGGGFVQWVTVSAFVTTLVLVLVRAFRVHQQINCFWELTELIYLAIYIVQMFIAAIVAGVRSLNHPSIMMACAICAVAFFIYLLDGIMAYKRYQVAKAQRQGSTEERSHQPVF